MTSLSAALADFAMPVRPPRQCWSNTSRPLGLVLDPHQGPRVLLRLGERDQLLEITAICGAKGC